MAENQNSQYNLYHYEIKSFDGKVTFKTEDKKIFTLVSNDEPASNWLVKVLDMHYVKEMYHPCHLTLKLAISPKSAEKASSVSFTDLQAIFSKASVTVKVKRKNGENVTDNDIASNYYVMMVEPIMKPNRTYEVILDAYSADYQLTIDKYSKCYLDLPLNTIIENGTKALYDKDKEKWLNFAIEYNSEVAGNLQIINYKSDDSNYKVYHTPYAVQYNESFYTFAARLAHRYGEFLFFENGKLQLGLDPERLSQEHKISDDPSKPAFKSFSQIRKHDSILGDKIYGSHYDYLNSDSLDQKQAFNYDLDYADDMNISSLSMNPELPEGDNNWRYYMDWVGLSQKCLTFLTAFRREDKGDWHYNVAEATNVLSAFTKLALTWVDAGFKARSKVDKTNEKYKKAIDDLEAAIASYRSEQILAERMRPFASYNTTEYMLETSRAAAKAEYEETLSKMKEPEADVKKNKLSDASKAMDKVKTLVDELSDKISSFKGKFNNPDSVLYKLESLAKGFSSSMSSGVGDSVKKDFDELIKNCKSTGEKQDGSKIKEAIDDVLDYIKKFEEKLEEENGGDDFTDLYELKDFCKQEVKPGEPDKAWRESFASEIQLLYRKIKDALNSAKKNLKDTKSEVDTILDAAAELCELERTKTEQKKNLTGLTLRIVKLNLLHKVLETVEKGEITSAANRVCLEIDTANYTQVPLLGECVSFGGIKYLIIKVESQLLQKENSASAYTETLKLELIPEATKKTSKESIDRNNVSMPEEVTVWMPPMSDVRNSVKVGSMIAVVTDNVDPLAMGRLRLRYKWQNEKDAATPWIRMATPFQSKDGAGMYFIPNKGDEVLVDFYNGNIDRPVVVGVLRNDTHDKDYAAGWASRRDITSASGQYLSFSESGNHAFTNVFKVFPGWGATMGAWNPTFAGKLNDIEKYAAKQDDNFAKYMHGSLNLGDCFGTWGITGDTGGRSVSISSNLGEITLDALTGISISAPLGDISISAKNISLEASNNITIESGTQIKRQRKIKKNFKEGIGDGIWGAVKNTIKGKTTLLTIDFSLLRFLMEAIIPPVEGTLQVKSNRYLKLEAGEKAKAEDQKRASVLSVGNFADSKSIFRSWIKPKSKFDVHAATYDHAPHFKKMNDALNAIPEFIIKLCKEMSKRRTDFYSAYRELRSYDLNGKARVKEMGTNFWDGLNSVDIKTFDSEIDDTQLNEWVTKITGLNSKEKINAAFSIGTRDLLDAFREIKIDPVAGSTVEEQQKQFYSANKKHFVKLAVEAASLAVQSADAGKTNFVNNQAKKIRETMGLVTDEDKFKNYTLNAAQNDLVESEFDAATVEGWFKPLFTAMYSDVDARKIPESRFSQEGYVNSITRIFLMKVIKETGWYVYDQGYAEASFSWSETIKKDAPENDDMNTFLGQTDLKYFLNDRNGANNSMWEFFKRGSKFVTEYWENPPLSKKVQDWGNIGGTIAEEILDLSGATKIFDDLFSSTAGTIKESAGIKSSEHGGRVLISDNGVSVGITKNGNTELTSLNYGKESWK